jgi:hypothetical protein
MARLETKGNPMIMIKLAFDVKCDGDYCGSSYLSEPDLWDQEILQYVYDHGPIGVEEMMQKAYHESSLSFVKHKGKKVWLCSDCIDYITDKTAKDEDEKERQVFFLNEEEIDYGFDSRKR